MTDFILIKKLNRAALGKLFVFVVLYLFTGLIIGSVFFLTPDQGFDIPILRTVIIIFASVLLLKYFVYMLLSPWNDVLLYFMGKGNTKRYKPLVSVIIPAWNEEVGIIHTLESLVASTYHHLEIVVINDGSTDNSDAIIRAFIEKYNTTPARHKKTIIYQYKKNEGKGIALNTGIRLSHGEIIISIDADCIVTENAVSHFVKYFANPKVMAAVGNVKIGNTKNIVNVVQYLEFLFSFYFKKADSLMNAIYIIGAAAGAFRREVFERVGYYNPKNITEDIDLSVRIQNAGMKIVYASDAIIYTEGAMVVKDLIKQRLRWKRGRMQTFAEFKHLFFSLDKKHNKILSWLVLPLAIFGEIQLSVELYFLGFLYVYSFLIRDFSSFISGIVVVSTMFLVQTLFDDPKSKKWWFYFISPIGWLLFYLATFVEYNALMRSLWSAFRKKEVTWQRWQRHGVHGIIENQD